MQFVKLNNGVDMPMIGFGVYQIPLQQTKECVLNAFEVGYRLIDTAQNYGNEAGVGEALTASAIPRKDVFVTTKVQSNRNVAASIDNSLHKLKTDYIDLLLIHWVMGNDLHTYHVLEDYYRQGKIRAIGLSNFYGKSLDNILRHCDVVPAVVQQETHIFHQNIELRKVFEKRGIVLQAWSPFGEGRGGIFQNPTLIEISKIYNKSAAQVILRFLLQSNIASIPKTIHRDRMIENLNIFDFSLNDKDMEAIKKLDQSKSLFGWFDET